MIFKWMKRRMDKSYEQLWFMVFGFDEYKSGLIYRYELALERQDSLNTTIDVLRKRVNKLEKELEHYKALETKGDEDGNSR